MNWLDIVIVVVILGFAYSALSAGLIREVVTLLAVVIGIVVAGQLYRNLATDILVFIDNEEAALAASFLALFGAAFLLGQIAAYVLKRTASLLMLGWADHLGGALFGLLKGLLVVQILLIVFAAYPQLGLDDVIDGSALGSIFLDDVDFILRVLPGEFEDRIDRFLSP
ncbi:MAG: CvpA family protein [Dehalococcoidia bacterium]